MAVRLLCGTAGGPSALAGAVAEERLDELFAVEYAQLVDAFADADVTDRDVELVADADLFVRILREGSWFDSGCTDEEYIVNFSGRYRDCLLYTSRCV